MRFTSPAPHPRSRPRRAPLAALAALLLAAPLAAHAQRAQQATPSGGGAAPPMVWRHAISEKTEKSRIARYGVGPYADGQTRLETELRAELPLDQVDAARDMMDALAADQGAAEKIFGADHKVVAMAKKPRKVWDLYLDTTDGKLAAANAGLRIRIENGTAQVNYKPPGGQFFVEGMKIGLEAGITIAADKTGKLPNKVIGFFRNTKLVDNPLRELMAQFPGLQVEDFFFLQLETRQTRKVYEVQELEGTQYVKKSEITVDRVTSRDPKNKTTKVEYGRVELEGDHVSAGQLNARQQAALASSTWKGPHKAADALDPQFANSDDVVKIRGYAKGLLGYLSPLGVTAVKGSKYVTSRELLGKLGVAFDRGKLMIKGLRRTRPQGGGAVRVSQTTQAGRRAVRRTR
jgi:hypothetical protein